MIASSFSNIDWSSTFSFVLSVISLLVAIVTLYVAYLRGPSISLASADESKEASSFDTRFEHFYFNVHHRFLFINTGNRSGVLFKFRFEPISYSDIKVDIEAIDGVLPKVIPSGEGYSVQIKVRVNLENDTSWDSFFESNKTLILKIKFMVSNEFGGRKTKVKAIELNLKRIQELYDFYFPAQMTSKVEEK